MAGSLLFLGSNDQIRLIKYFRMVDIGDRMDRDLFALQILGSLTVRGNQISQQRRGATAVWGH